MRIVFAIYTTLIILTISCKKSNDQINTPPVVADTSKLPVVKGDTSTLLKSQLIYTNYSGAAFLDSELKQWTYDDQRRVTQKTYAYYNSINGIKDFYIDSTRFTYLNDRYTQSTNYYKNGSLRAATNIVYYRHMGNRIDSIFYSSLPATYFYYNQENQDSLDLYFNNVTGVPSLEYSVNYFYTGLNLDSAIIQLDTLVAGVTNYYVDYFSGGNLTSQSYYENNVFKGATTFSYTNIPTGGLYIADVTPIGWLPFFYRTTYMVSAFNLNSYTYELDASNRVTTMTGSTNGVISQKYVFTYY